MSLEEHSRLFQMTTYHGRSTEVELTILLIIILMELEGIRILSETMVASVKCMNLSSILHLEPLVERESIETQPQQYMQRTYTIDQMEQAEIHMLCKQ